MEETEKIRFEDSNLAMLGSIYEKALRMQRAEAEPEWKKIQKSPGLYIWRIEKFKVVPWPKADYGKFFQGDTFIILSISKNEENNSLDYTAHMWVGKDSTCDETGTGAYKIVELDDYFNRQITLVYEEQDYESFIFLSYFENIQIMQGGIESGFKQVGKIEYTNHLFQITKQNKCILNREVPLQFTSLNSNDVFVLDAGLKIFIWKGFMCSPFASFPTHIKITSPLSIKNVPSDFKDSFSYGTLVISYFPSLSTNFNNILTYLFIKDFGFVAFNLLIFFSEENPKIFLNSSLSSFSSNSSNFALPPLSSNNFLARPAPLNFSKGEHIKPFQIKIFNPASRTKTSFEFNDVN